MTAVAYHAGRFPPRTLDWERLLPLIGPANAAIARYDCSPFPATMIGPDGAPFSCAR